MIDENLEKSLSFVDDLLGRCQSIAKKHFEDDASPSDVIGILHAVMDKQSEIVYQKDRESIILGAVSVVDN